MDKQPELVKEIFQKLYQNKAEKFMESFKKKHGKEKVEQFQEWLNK